MSIFDQLKNAVSAASAASAAPNPPLTPKPQNESHTFTFNALPESVDEMKALPEASLDTPYKTAALTLLALCAYAAAPEIGKEMLNFLKGPSPLSPAELSFLNERFRDGKHIPFSYFKGAVPENNYTPDEPFTITVFSNPYSFPSADRATLHINSGGADSPRQVTLRLKPGEGKWYLNEQMVMVGIRTPKAQDPWA